MARENQGEAYSRSIKFKPGLDRYGSSVNAAEVVVVGGGPAGFFGAITCAEHTPGTRIVLFERGAEFLAKVRISGGGRCNVTHACFDPAELVTRFPRGQRELIAPFHQFQASDVVAWFQARGVPLKTEDDGRMFPVTDQSRTVIDCLMNAARAAGIELCPSRGIDRVTRRADGKYELTVSSGETIACDRVLLATGGCRGPAAGALATSLGHTLAAPVPSLFTFHIATPWVRGLAGVSAGPVRVSAASGLREEGILLFTHWGLSGPVILRLSAWGARALHACHYQFPLQINWLPRRNAGEIAATFQSLRQDRPDRRITNTPLPPLPARLWEQLVIAAGIAPETRWAELSRSAAHQLTQQLVRTELPVTGRSLNKDEFVTCGGVRLNEINFKTMESRLCPGLYFAGELLDVDGITGGYNFQACWTTGWIAGRHLAAARRSRTSE